MPQRPKPWRLRHCEGGWKLVAFVMVYLVVRWNENWRGQMGNASIASHSMEHVVWMVEKEGEVGLFPTVCEEKAVMGSEVVGVSPVI